MILALNIISLLIIFGWAFYHQHVTDYVWKRVAYILILFPCTLMLVLMFIPIDNQFYVRDILWQPLALRLVWAFYAIVDFCYEYGSERFIEAFKNNKERLLHITKR